MALRKILFCGDPRLRKRARKVHRVDAGLRQLMADMVETMREAPGVGLAAPQVGVPVRAICVADWRDQGDEEESPGAGGAAADEAESDESDESDETGTEGRVWCLINPAIIHRSKETESGREGCLSLPTLVAWVPRAREVVVRAEDLDGNELTLEAEGMGARVLQHELDHLQGVLFIDRCERETLAWMIPDKNDDRGYRLADTDLEEVLERFERLRQREDAQ